MLIQIKAILFDKDGTLFDFEATWGRWCARTIAQLLPSQPDLRIKLADACGYDIETNRFRAGSVIVNGTVQETSDAWINAVPALTETQIRDVAEAQLIDLPLVPTCDLHLVLSQLRAAGYILGVATNDNFQSVTRQLAQAGISDHFVFVAGADSGYGAKPDVGMIAAFCAQIGVEPNLVAMVGDSTHDLDTAANAGSYGVGVLTGPATRDDITPFADVVLNDISELQGHLTTD